MVVVVVVVVMIRRPCRNYCPVGCLCFCERMMIPETTTTPPPPPYVFSPVATLHTCHHLPRLYETTTKHARTHRTAECAAQVATGPSGLVHDEPFDDVVARHLGAVEHASTHDVGLRTSSQRNAPTIVIAHTYVHNESASQISVRIYLWRHHARPRAIPPPRRRATSWLPATGGAQQMFPNRNRRGK